MNPLHQNPVIQTIVMLANRAAAALRSARRSHLSCDQDRHFASYQDYRDAAKLVARQLAPSRSIQSISISAPEEAAS